MSSFIVEDKTINRVVNYIAYDHKYTYIRRRAKEELGFDLTTPEGQQQLGWAMFKLNIRAVNQRYEDGQADQFRPLDYKYHIIGDYSLPAMIKSLACWLYQVSEGDCPESALYKFMQWAKGELCYRYVSQTKEFEAADTWN